MESNQEMLEHGSFAKLAFRLGLPTIVIMLVMVIYNMADTFFIGQTQDPGKLAAVSLCAPIFTMLSGIGTLLGSGGCTAISIALGRRDTKQIKAYTSICCAGSLLLGAAFSAVIIAMISPVSALLGAGPDTMAYTRSYLGIIAGGAPIILFNNVFTNIIRADGAARESMMANAIGTITNILLDAVFILIFSWGVAGAAIATVIGNAAGSLYLLWYIRKKQTAFSLSPKDIILKKEIILPLITLGLPLACSTLLISCSGMISNRFLISYGSIPLAAQGISGKIGMLISMTAMGICMGFQPAVSFNYGRGNKKRLYELIKKIGILTVAVGSILTTICFLFRIPLISLFIKNSEVTGYAETMILAPLITGPFTGLYQLCQTFLQSTGKASYATFAALLDKGILYIPMLFIMKSVFGLYGIVFSSAVTFIFSLSVSTFLCLKWNKSISHTPTASSSEPALKKRLYA
ncbi:MAG TPA: MATE family efflux transporter [Lachnospiraceae bacterium]|nr:MATE family efflux transporter [Lachnospiraceae bacterium]